MATDIGVIDACSGGKDKWTYCSCGWRVDKNGREYIAFERVGAFVPELVRALGGAAVMDRIIDALPGIRMIAADQRDRLTVEDACRRRGVSCTIYDWKSSDSKRGLDKPAAVERVRAWFRERVISIPPNEQFRRELVRFEERLTTKGQYTYGGKGEHDDHVSLLLTAALADLDGRIPRAGAPSGYEGPLPPPVTYSGFAGMGGGPSVFDGDWGGGTDRQTQALADYANATNGFTGERKG